MNKKRLCYFFFFFLIDTNLNILNHHIRRMNVLYIDAYCIVFHVVLLTQISVNKGLKCREEIKEIQL